jgi:hypothetical protein
MWKSAGRAPSLRVRAPSLLISWLKELINERATCRLIYLVKIIDLPAATVLSTHVIGKKASDLSL